MGNVVGDLQNWLSFLQTGIDTKEKKLKELLNKSSVFFREINTKMLRENYIEIQKLEKNIINLKVKKLEMLRTLERELISQGAPMSKPLETNFNSQQFSSKSAVLHYELECVKKQINQLRSVVQDPQQLENRDKFVLTGKGIIAKSYFEPPSMPIEDEQNNENIMPVTSRQDDNIKKIINENAKPTKPSGCRTPPFQQSPEALKFMSTFMRDFLLQGAHQGKQETMAQEHSAAVDENNARRFSLTN